MDMTSLLCVRQPGGSVQLHENKIIGELMQQDTFRTPERRKKQRRPYSTPNLGGRTAPLDQDTFHKDVKIQSWLSEKTIKNVQDKADTESKKTKKMYDAVLETEDTFVKGVTGFLENKEMLNLRKKEILHKKWNDRVYHPIRNQVVNAVNSNEYSELDLRKRELYKEYLEHVNRKGHVFLDTIAPEEYYPLSLHPVRPSLLTAQTKSLRDPLLSQSRERTAEDKMIFRCLTGSTVTDRDMETIRLPLLPLVPLGRHGTECNTWLAMPMGDIESPVRLASRSRMMRNYNDSHFAFEEWAHPSCDPKVVDHEMQIQRRKRCPTEMSSIAYKPVSIDNAKLPVAV